MTLPAALVALSSFIFFWLGCLSSFYPLSLCSRYLFIWSFYSGCVLCNLMTCIGITCWHKVCEYIYLPLMCMCTRAYMHASIDTRTSDIKLIVERLQQCNNWWNTESCCCVNLDLTTSKVVNDPIPWFGWRQCCAQSVFHQNLFS